MIFLLKTIQIFACKNLVLGALLPVLKSVHIAHPTGSRIETYLHSIDNMLLNYHIFLIISTKI